MGLTQVFRAYVESHISEIEMWDTPVSRAQDEMWATCPKPLPEDVALKHVERRSSLPAHRKLRDERGTDPSFVPSKQVRGRMVR